VEGLAENMADEIRTKEAAAHEIVSNAKAEGARLLASARTLAEQSIKEAKQKSHRFFRDQVKAAETEADAAAVKTVAAGKADADKFYAGSKSKTANVADWLVKEVISTYGNS
jgi:V/A-type H+-transporting ATPase subunit G/H